MPHVIWHRGEGSQLQLLNHLDPQTAERRLRDAHEQFLWRCLGLEAGKERQQPRHVLHVDCERVVEVACLGGQPLLEGVEGDGLMRLVREQRRRDDVPGSDPAQLPRSQVEELAKLHTQTGHQEALFGHAASNG